MKTQLHKGTKVELTIASLAPGGEGVSKDLGMPVFVNRTAVNDRVLVELFDCRPHFARGRVLEILTPSPDRIEPPCKIFKVCGGCQWQHISYEGQLKGKEEIIKQSLKHIGSLDTAMVKPALKSKKEFFYRNKVQFPVRQPNDSPRILAGYYEQDSHKLVNVKHCPIQPAPLDKMLELTKEALEKFGISAYDEITGKGRLRFINARYSEANGSILITLVMNCLKEDMPKRLTDLAKELMAQMPEITGVCVNFNTKAGNKILGDETICLAGQPYIEEVLRSEHKDYPEKLQNGLKFKLSPESFFQVNTTAAISLFEQLSEHVKEFALKEKISSQNLTIIDAYAGVGAIALWLSPFCKKVIAIEENKSAVEDGEGNLAPNQIENVEFCAGKVETVLPELIEQKLQPEIIVLDPPRKGCSPAALEAIMKLAPAMVLYVSCNPVTLARDLKILQTSYTTEEVLPVDLFPQTYHIESVTVLRRR